MTHLVSSVTVSSNNFSDILMSNISGVLYITLQAVCVYVNSASCGEHICGLQRYSVHGVSVSLSKYKKLLVVLHEVSHADAHPLCCILF